MRGRSSSGDVTGKVVDTSSDLALKRNRVLRSHPGQRALVITVQIGKTLERPLLAAGEEPVDGPAFVGFQVIFEEILSEVAADRVARMFVPVGSNALGDELEILFQVFLWPGHAYELDETISSIVRKPVCV